jgi:hypothetical protein
MGAGVPRLVVNTLLLSLNTMFDSNHIGSLKQKYQTLKGLYPSFMSYTPPGGDRHVWRQSTLRYAGWLLTSEVDVTSETVAKVPDYPGQNFIKWLKWLTWMQMLGPNDAIVTIIPAPPKGTPAAPPAKAILDTLNLALQDAAANGVHFKWTEIAVGGQMTVSVNQTPGNYSVTIVSIRADNVANASDNDEDTQLP